MFNFQRPSDVNTVQMKSNRRQNNVLCLQGLVVNRVPSDKVWKGESVKEKHLYFSFSI